MFIRQVSLFLSLFLIVAQGAFAGTATLSGYGEVNVQPEFATVTVNVKSECFSSAQAVSSANDQVAEKVMNILKFYSNRANNDEVVATGGFVERYTGYDSSRSQPICIQKFKKQNELTLKIHSIESFPQIFAELQEKIYALGMESSRESLEVPTSFIEMGSPKAGLSPLSLKNFERKALLEALRDAKEKFEMTISLVGIQSYKIVNYNESILVPGPFRDQTEKNRLISTPPAPIQFGNMKISKYLNVQFEYQGDNLNISF